MNKNDTLLPKKRGKNVVPKSKKDSLPQTSVTPPFIVKFKLARNTNKKQRLLIATSVKRRRTSHSRQFLQEWRREECL